MPKPPKRRAERSGPTNDRSPIDPVVGFANIEALVDGLGSITVGEVGPIRCAATAAEEDRQLAMLVRKPDESFTDLLERLDAAIGSAWDDEIFIDEINGDPDDLPKHRSRLTRSIPRTPEKCT